MTPARGNHTIAIVGGGFSGALTAVHLLRRAGAAPSRSTPLRVVLIERGARMARGLAYGARCPLHLLNVPAGNMSALEQEPDDFVRYCQRRGEAVDATTFVPRQLYGDYLDWLLRDAAEAARRSGKAVLDCARGDVLECQVTDHAALTLADGVVVLADQVVLAFGHFGPGLPPPLTQQAGVVGNSATAGALDEVDPARPVLIVGSGHTAVDTIMALQLGNPDRVIHLVSRHGLLPQPHRPLRLPVKDLAGLMAPLVTALLTQAPLVRTYLRTVRQAIRILARDGLDWRDVIGALRPVTPSLWRRLAPRERARFLRHVRPYWEVHRHRLAPQIDVRLQQLIQSGRLKPMAGRIGAVDAHQGHLRVKVIPRHGGTPLTMDVGALINCTRGSCDLKRLDHALPAQLRRDGYLLGDAFNLGLLVADNYALIGANGLASTRLHYVGPFLCADFWEASAVPELRAHAARLADILAEKLNQPVLHKSQVAVQGAVA